MSEPLAMVSDLEIRLKVEVGSLAGVDLTAAETYLQDATVLVLAVGNPTWTPESVPDAVKRVVIGCALRTYRNPDGFTSENYGGAYSYTMPETTGYLTEDELEIIAKAVEDEETKPKTIAVGSVRTPSAYSAGGGYSPDPWWW